MKTRNQDKLSLILASLFSGLLLIAAACSGGIDCGPGTIEQDGSCVPQQVCEAGTVADPDSGACVPACGANEYFDGDACRQMPECADGTRFDETTRTCVPDCAQGQYWDGDACRRVPICATGTALDPSTGTCMPDGSGCAPGTTYDATTMVCRPDATACGAGTHPDGQGACVPDRLPEPDVSESEDPDGAASFELPAEGEQISLGGVVNLPTDIDGDGYADQDWDLFIFSGQAGDHLRIHATSEGACLPSFLLISEARDDMGYALYYRASVNPLGVDNSRDVYLPVDGNYMLWVNDIGPVLGAFFGLGTLPIGGPEFSYYLSVERLPSPEPAAISTLPGNQQGALDSGQLAFFDVQNVSMKDILAFHSSSPAQAPASSDLWNTLMVFAPDGRLLREAQAGSLGDDIRTLVAADSDGSYLVVQDFLLSTGPLMDFSLSANSLPIEDCNNPGACAGGALAEDEFRVLRWDLSPGDFFIFSGSLPTGAAGRLRLDLLASDLSSMSFCSAGADESCWRHHYATTQSWIYVWIRGFSNEAIAGYGFDNLLVAPPALSAGSNTGFMPTVDMPADSLADGGLARIEAAAGQVLYLLDLQRQGAWSNPFIEILDTALRSLGPPLDTASPTLDSMQNTAMAWARQDQTLLLRYSEEGQDLSDAEWSLTPHLLSPQDLGLLEANPIELTGASLPSDPVMALFRVEVSANSPLRIRVQPESGAELWPRIELYARGYHYQTSWTSSPAMDELGRIGLNAAGAAGEAAEINTTAPYDGELLIRLHNVHAAGNTDLFDLTISAP